MINWLMCLIKGDINNNDVPDRHEITWDIIQGTLEEEDLENDRSEGHETVRAYS